MAVIALAPAISFDEMPIGDKWSNALIEARVDHAFQVPGRVTLTFSDPGYALTSTNTLKLGTVISLRDVSGENLSLITAEVTSIGVEQREGEHPELVVVGHDKSHRLGRASKVRTFSEMTYPDIIAEIASSASLVPEVDSSSLVLDWLMQADTDLGLLTELSRRMGFDWWVEGEILKCKKPSAGASVTLTLGEDLMSFSAKAAGHRPDSVTVDGWDRSAQELVTSTASSATEGVTASSDLADLVSDPGSAFGQGKLLSAGLSPQSSSEADELSQALFDRASASSVSAQGVCVGNGNLKLGAVAHIGSAGPLSGSYPVTRVEHIFRARTGFITRFFSGDRRPTTLVDSLSGTRVATPATHRLGLSVAQVTNTNDPDKKGRVKVRYPGVESQYETGWARIVGIGGGAGRGSVFIPEVNDEVLVGFEGGDPRQPVVLGGLFGDRATMPTTAIEDGVVQQRAITSRLGHVVNLLDGTEPSKQAIELTLAGGTNSLHLGADKLSIAMDEGLPIEITVGESSIKFGDDGSITITAPQVTINAEQKFAVSSAQVNVNADAQMNLQSDGTAALKGATVQVQGEGPLQIQGEPVAIN
jgi:uncharacterized protein involved in type VI secretion and phage assembly